MKLILVVFLICCFSKSATAQNDHANLTANKIAQKMKDTLNLTAQQKNAIKNINMELHERKKKAREKSTDRVIVGRDLQKIENKRDSLFKTVLTTEQYILYMKKKRKLVSN